MTEAIRRWLVGPQLAQIFLSWWFFFSLEAHPGSDVQPHPMEHESRVRAGVPMITKAREKRVTGIESTLPTLWAAIVNGSPSQHVVERFIPVHDRTQMAIVKVPMTC